MANEEHLAILRQGVEPSAASVVTTARALRFRQQPLGIE